jgi:hypothetical protein
MIPSCAIIPIITGNAPGIAPTITATVLYLFRGVYKKAYVTSESVPRKEVNGFRRANNTNMLAANVMRKPPETNTTNGKSRKSEPAAIQ